MLRESMQNEGHEVDLGKVAHGMTTASKCRMQRSCSNSPKRSWLRDAPRIAAAARQAAGALGDAGFVDAAAITAAFHGFVRIADAIGIPYATAAGGEDRPEIRAAAGVDEFYRVRAS